MAFRKLQEDYFTGINVDNILAVNRAGCNRIQASDKWVMAS